MRVTARVGIRVRVDVRVRVSAKIRVRIRVVVRVRVRAWWKLLSRVRPLSAPEISFRCRVPKSAILTGSDLGSTNGGFSLWPDH